jgi:hypothetical protein
MTVLLRKDEEDEEEEEEENVRNKIKNKKLPDACIEETPAVDVRRQRVSPDVSW